MEKLMNPDLFKDHLEDKFYIYLHVTKDDKTPFYIGKGKNKRCFDTYNRNDWWVNIVNKHDYLILILEINLSEEISYEKEKYWISYFGRKQFKNGGTLVNLTDGGEGVSGKIYTEEEKEKKSKYFKLHPEIWSSGINREKYFGKQLFGEDNPNFGNKYEKNPLSKPVVKLSLNGDFIDQYPSILFCSEKNEVKPTSVSACCLNKRHQLKGYKYVFLSDYEKNNIIITSGKNSKKQVNQIDLFSNEIICTYNSCAATKENGFNPTNVGQVCRGEKKTHKGYKWEYIK